MGVSFSLSAKTDPPYQNLDEGGAGWFWKRVCETSYGGFGHVRNRVATYEGIFLPAMRGHWSYYIKWEPEKLTPKQRKRTKGKSWKKIDSVLIPFFNHSDAEGFWTPEECEQMHERLAEIGRLIREEDVHRWGDGEFVTSLADGMKTAAKDGLYIVLT